jgi:hypothetical protein
LTVSHSEGTGRLAFVISVAAAAGLGAASFGWTKRLSSPAPAIILGLVATLLVPAVVPALVHRVGHPPGARGRVRALLGSWLSFFAGMAIAYLA